MSFCHSCGTEIIESDINCSKCGTNLEKMDFKKVLFSWVVENIFKSRTGFILVVLMFNVLIAGYTAFSVGFKSDNSMADVYSALQALISVTSLGFIGILLKK